MKNTITSYLFFCAVLIAPFFARPPWCAADTVYFDIKSMISDTDAGQELSLSETIVGGDAPKTYWYSSYDAATGEFSGDIADLSFSFLNDPSNTVVFGGGIDDQISGLKGRRLVIDGSHTVNVKEIVSSKTDTWIGSENAFLKGESASNTICIGAYVPYRNSQRIGFCGAQTVLKIDNFVDAAYNLGSLDEPLNRIEIGEMTLYMGNNTRASYIAAFGGDGRDSRNPDVKIGRLTTSIDTSYMSSNLLFANSSFQTVAGALDTNSYVQIGRVDGNAGLGMGYTDEQSTGSVTYIFVNSQDSSSGGNLVQMRGDVSSGFISDNPMTTRGARVNYVMRSMDSDGNYSDKLQSFSGAYSVISGDVRLESGGLFINYGGYGNSREVVYIGGKENDFSVKGALVFDRAEGAPCAKFGSTGDVGNTYVFGDLRVEGGGELVVRLDSSGGELLYDKLHFDGEVGGGGTLAIEFCDPVEGGLSELAMKSLVSEYGLDGIKIISWNISAAADAQFVAAEGMEHWVDPQTGQIYAFQAHAAQDGLYVSYVAVPEPAASAAVAAAAALCAVAYLRERRRQGACGRN